MQPVRKPAHAPQAQLKLTPANVQEFAKFFYEHSGITFPDSKLTLLQTQLGGLLAKLGLERFEEAMGHLRSPRGSADLQTVTNALTINETYFYREKYQFDVLAKTLLPEITKNARRGAPIRIWSLPCSTGEEPYSIAIYLRENWADMASYRVEIFGSDIDTDVLKKAVQAQYASRAVSRMPKELHARYFSVAASGTRYSLKRDVAESVTFNQANLLDRRSMSSMSGMDVIFCRNVLIYLDDSARRTAVKNLSDCLKPGGTLMLGHSETMNWLSSMFTIERKGGAVLYRKR